MPHNGKQLKSPTSELRECIKPYIHGKKVLDIGSINHSFNPGGGSRGWIFDFVLKEAEFVKGIDFQKEQVKIAQSSGYNIDFGNAETYIASDRYDVVLATDLIEHLSNPGQFFECSEKNLEPNGKLILATPNTFSFVQLYLTFKNWTNNPPVHWEHTFYFSPTTLETLASRYGFSVEVIKYANIDYANITILQKLLMSFSKLILRVWPKFSTTFIMVFTKKHDQ